MSTRFKSITGTVLRTLFLILMVETLCWIFRPHRHIHIGFLVNIHHKSAIVRDPGNGFDQVDPLLGYSKTQQQLENQGLKVEPCCPVMEAYDDTAKQVKIFITGGSTSDLSLYPGCWPIELFRILKEHGINAKLYCAGTGGYNTGQEFLKLVRDGVDKDLLIHISYSGANDYVTQSFVSTYEQNFYEAEFEKGNTSWLLPNTMYVLRRLLKLNHPNVTLYIDPGLPGTEFWEKNMRLMHGIALEHNYHFIGVLQPVLGSGKYTQHLDAHLDAVQEYRERYPKMRQAVGRHPDFLVDLSGIFDTCKGNVFIDNCHIRNDYQILVAESIYAAMVQKNVFAK